MKEEGVSVAMFQIWSESQRDMLKVLTAAIATTNDNITIINENIAGISQEIKESNALSREDIAVTKATLTQHITEYNFFTKIAEEKFVEIDKQQDLTTKTLESRKDLYDSALRVKVGLSFVGMALIAGVISAWGKEIVKWFSA